MSPTQRSMNYLRKQGFIVYKTEHWNAFARCRVDAFCFGDLLVAGQAIGIVLVQVTTTGNLSAREKKIRSLPGHRIWLESGGHIWLHGWSKKGPRGKRKEWTLTEREVE